jgi:hypothetical protein
MTFDHRRWSPGSTSSEAAPESTPGKRTLVDSTVQLRADEGGGHAVDVQEVAASGLQGTPGALPHRDTIQQAFGRHDVGGIQAFVGGPATHAAHQLGARAFATNNATAFAAPPDLHTAAHEAAHIVQQRGEVRLKGLGARGDRYEQHADAVADRVTQGRSAETLLDEFAPRGGRSASPAPGVSLERTDRPTPPTAIPPGGEAVNQIGVVAWDQSPALRLRTSPSTDGENVAGDLTFNTHLQVIKRFPGDWLFVSATNGNLGYVGAKYVWSAPEHPVPEPNARLHRVAGGAQGAAISIAERYYRESARDWGRDLRFYVAALAAANHITLPSSNDGWRSVQFQENQFIWVPSTAFALSMQGTINSGSASYEAADSVGIAHALERLGELRADFQRAIELSQQLLPAAIARHVAEQLRGILQGLALMVVGGIGVLAVTTAIGSLAGPGGTAVGFQVGMLLIEYLGLAFLAQWIADSMVQIASSFARFFQTVWNAHGNAEVLSRGSEQFADAIGVLIGVLVAAVAMWATSVGARAAISRLQGTAFGRALGETALGGWLARGPGRTGPEGTRPGGTAPEGAGPEGPRPQYDPGARTDTELQADSDRAPRFGETPEQAQARVRQAQDELARRGKMAACFVAGTLVHTPSGPIPIEQLAHGTAVFGRPDTAIGDPSAYAIADRMLGQTRTLYHVTLDGDHRITTTRNHPFYVAGAGWKNAHALAPGDLLETLEGGPVAVTAIEKQRMDDWVPTYNVHVDVASTYYVGAAGGPAVWVHNADPNDPSFLSRLLWGLSGNGPRQRDSSDPNPDFDGASAFETNSRAEVERFMGVRAGQGQAKNKHGAITPEQLASSGLVAVETPSDHALTTQAGLKHYSIRPVETPDPKQPLTPEQMSAVKAKLDAMQPVIQAKPRDFGCG